VGVVIHIDFFAVKPAPPLDRFVEAIWAVRGEDPTERSAVLPNGAMQLIVNFGAPHRVLAFGDRACERRYDEAWIAGLQSGALTIGSPRFSDLLGIRFRPGGAHAFLPVPPSALLDDVVEACDLLSEAAGSLRERLGLAPTRAAQAAVAQAWLMERLRPRERDFLLVERAIAMLSRLDRRESVTATCERLGISNRHLVCLFRDIVGVPPKTLARIQRFHAALCRLPASPAITSLALEHGYFDQAHFNHEFRRLAGVTPTEFVACRGIDDESVVL
jgi:AraC-like DNA-binding protein